MSEKQTGLKEVLEDVRRIKANSYVGTREALSLIRLKTELEERPQRICDLVNKELGNVNYVASPELIAWLDDVTTEIYWAIGESSKHFIALTLEEQTKVFDEIAKDLTSIDQGENVFAWYDENKKIVKKQISSDLVERITKCYKKANEAGVSTDQDFKNFVIDEYVPLLLHGKIKRKYIQALTKIPTVFGARDEDSALFPNFLYRANKIHTKHEIKGSIEHSIVGRVLNDRIGREKKYGREIVDISLLKYLDKFNEEMFGDDKTQDPEVVYNLVIKSLDSKLNELTNIMKLFENEPSVDKKEYWQSQQNIRELALIREIYGREKKYVVLKIKNLMKSTEDPPEKA